MNNFLLIFSLLFLFSCKKNLSKENEIIEQSAIENFVAISSAGLNTVNDTLYFKDKKFSGVLFSLSDFSSDTLTSIGYRNGVLDGVSKKWYASGQLMEWRSYRTGEKDGPQIAYFENGNKKFEYTAEKDFAVGIMREWNDSGNLVHLATYEKGQEEGVQKMWYDNGKIRANYVMIKGRRYGLLGTKNCTNVSDSLFVVR
jgi:antitoxin component YwqK of YwqJK toxin-antitoxin module